MRKFQTKRSLPDPGYLTTVAILDTCLPIFFSFKPMRCCCWLLVNQKAISIFSSTWNFRINIVYAKWYNLKSCIQNIIYSHSMILFIHDKSQQTWGQVISIAFYSIFEENIPIFIRLSDSINGIPTIIRPALSKNSIRSYLCTVWKQGAA